MTSDSGTHCYSQERKGDQMLLKNCTGKTSTMLFVSIKTTNQLCCTYSWMS